MAMMVVMSLSLTSPSLCHTLPGPACPAALCPLAFALSFGHATPPHLSLPHQDPCLPACAFCLPFALPALATTFLPFPFTLSLLFPTLPYTYMWVGWLPCAWDLPCPGQFFYLVCLVPFNTPACHACLPCPYLALLALVPAPCHALYPMPHLPASL